MKWNQEDLLCEFEVLKGKFSDVLTIHDWHGDDMFRLKKLKDNSAIEHYVLGYNESRIQHEQTADLLTMYLNEFEKLISRFNELLEQEKSASSKASKQKDDTQN
ncbi:MAG: type II toxin-antitoxin system toxin TscT [Staphylococcus sp.]|uniref:type II toxin-antitoxin system toxin TscT n=1 Tax=Staphylococcus sp. TaxID=29387 RepID=UPI003F943310